MTHRRFLAVSGLIAIATLALNSGRASPAQQTTVSPLPLCANSLRDQANQPACVTASSVPTLGTLYPLGPAFNIDAGGNIGIGTTVPLERLDVAGMIHSRSGGFRFPDGTVQTTAASFNGQPYADGTLVEALAPTTKNSSTSFIWEKLKEFSPLHRGGIVTVTYEAMYGTTNDRGSSHNARLYINDVPVGTVNNVPNNFYSTYSDSGIVVGAGDVIQIYGQGNSRNVNVRNVRISCANPTIPAERL